MGQRDPRQQRNVFADLGLPDAPELLARADLAIEIGRVLDERALAIPGRPSAADVAAPHLGPAAGRLEGFTLDRLVRFLNALDQDVEMRIRPKQAQDARLVVAR